MQAPLASPSARNVSQSKIRQERLVLVERVGAVIAMLLLGIAIVHALKDGSEFTGEKAIPFGEITSGMPLP